MEDEEQRLRRVITLIIESGYQLNSDTLMFIRTLSQSENLEEIIKKTIEELSGFPEKPLFFPKEFLETTIANATKKKLADSFGSIYTPYAKEVEGKIDVLEEPTERVGSRGSIEEYLSYFKDRFAKINRILRERVDVRNAVPIVEALKASLNSRVKTIGIVVEKRDRKKTIFIRIEDYEASLTILVPSTSDRTLLDKTRKLFLDQVVCVEATKIRENVFIAKDFISPDIPEKKINTASDEVYVALTSDIHVGNRKFLENTFDRFIGWLKGNEGNNHQREIASRVKYLIIAGDVVDGIGVYPNQENELVISDLYNQYRLASKFLEKIPEYIEIVIIPGNHDATRQALPQPPILKKYAEPIYNLKNVRMLGDPARIQLHGVEVLTYHGRSLDDIIGAVPGVTYLNLGKNIATAMEYLLKVRHLAPIYGSKTPIAPAPIDELVINSPPDILHAGHIHVMGYKLYRGTLLINSGAWQGQTEFQEKMGLIPTPGIVPVVDLKSFKVMPIDFLSQS